MNPTTPDMPESGTPNLRRAVAALLPHEPDAATWPRLAAQLAADEALARAIPALPAHEPADDLWASITACLDTGEIAVPEADAASVPAVLRTLPPPGRPAWLSRPARRALALAASVLLLLGGWWGLRPATAPVATALHETVAYSEEVAPVASEPRALTAVPFAAPDPLEQQGRAFIDAHCSSLPTVCQSGEFRSLRTQLTELEGEEARLRLDARRFGASPELLREQTQLINLKAAVTRELVQLLIS
jgi:hypothetical protein